MAELKILRVFLILVHVCVIEISSQNLVNEDYYSFEDTSNLPTEAPTYNRNIVTQNASTDALKRVSTSEAAINIMEVDGGSGEGEINQTDKMGDLSTEKYLFQEDLPSAEEIFKTFENETAEATTTSRDLETTKEEHIKQIFEKLGVTKDMVTDLFGAAVTESIESPRRAENSKETTDLEKEFLLSAPVNGNLQITNLGSVVVVDKDKNGNFLENDSKSTSAPVYANKEMEDELFNIISDKDEDIFNESFVDNLQPNEDKKLTDERTEIITKANEQEEVTVKAEAVTAVSSNFVDETTPKLESTDTAETFDKESVVKDLLSSSEVNYDNYYGSRFEENYIHQTKPVESATVDPALYEYEAHSNEEETVLSTTVKVTEETSDSIFTTSELSIDDSPRQNKGLELNGHNDISDKLDFESSTTISVLQEGFSKATTEKAVLDEDFQAVIDTDVNTEEIMVLSTSETTNIYNTLPVVTTGQITEEMEPEITEGTAQTLSEEIITVPTPTFRFITEVPNEKERSMDEALENAFETSTISSDVIVTEARKPQNNHVPFDEDVISITTHTPTARILTESVSLVTENRVTNNGKLSDPSVSPCLRLNFTGHLKTNETTIPIPDYASLFGTCDSNGVFVNVSWESEHRVKATLFFNFTEDLLTNVQLNLLYDNTLFEQSKRVELGSTSQKVTIEFENEHRLVLTFFEFSTRYHDSSLTTSTERFEIASSTEDLQSSTSLIVLQIVAGSASLIIVIAVAGLFAFKKYGGQRANFKPNAETA